MSVADLLFLKNLLKLAVSAAAFEVMFHVGLAWADWGCGVFWGCCAAALLLLQVLGDLLEPGGAP